MSSRRERFDGGPRNPEPPPAPDPLAVPAFDSHCHLDLMDAEPAEALSAARAVGITRVVTVGIDVATSQWCADTAAAYDDVYATVAIHPNEAPRAGEEEWSAIAALARRPEVCAVGETGIDHYRTSEDGWDAQEESFRRHIAI